MKRLERSEAIERLERFERPQVCVDAPNAASASFDYASNTSRQVAHVHVNTGV
jgi:hypothetical protein